jgi:hypothetical protein
LGLTGSGRVDLNDPIIPDELRDELSKIPVPAWYNDQTPTTGSFRSFR